MPAELPPKRGTTLTPTKRVSQTNEADLSNQDIGLLTVQDLNNILEVNQKALTIYLEVERQNEHVLEVLQEEADKLDRLEVIEDEVKDVRRDIATFKKSVDEVGDTAKEIKKKLEDIDKNMFRLVLILGSAGIGTIITIIQAFLTHK